MPITASDLAIRAEIEDVVVRYATAIDTGDWDLFRSVVTDEATIDYGPMMGSFDGGEAFTSFMREAHAAAGPSVHRMTNIVVKQGAELTARTYGDSLIQHKGDAKTVDHGAAYYDDTFVRTDEGLKISARTTTMILFERTTANTVL